MFVVKLQRSLPLPCINIPFHCNIHCECKDFYQLLFCLVLCDINLHLERTLEGMWSILGEFIVKENWLLDTQTQSQNLDFFWDSEPTLEELGKAIDALTYRKAPGEDSRSPEIIKCGKSAPLEPFHELWCLCWREGRVPLDMRNAKILTLYKK